MTIAFKMSSQRIKGVVRQGLGSTKVQTGHSSNSALIFYCVKTVTNPQNLSENVGHVRVTVQLTIL